MTTTSNPIESNATELPELTCLIDGVDFGTGVGMDAEHPVGGREGYHLISAHAGIVPVAEVYSYGSEGSADDGPVLQITGEQAKAYAEMFARAPDWALMLAGITRGVLRWERWNDQRGELRIGGMCYPAYVDAFGCPVLTPMVRAALSK